MILSKSLPADEAKRIVRKIDSTLCMLMDGVYELRLYQDRDGYYHILSLHDLGYSKGKRGWKRLNPYGGDG